MISADLRVEGFDARSFTNLVSLFAPQVVNRMQRGPDASDAPEIESAETLAGKSGTLVIIVTESGRVRKAFHTQVGRVRGLVYPGPAAMPALAAEYHAARCVVLREGAIEEISERIAARLERGDDYLAQWLVVARAVREAIESELVHVWPRPNASVPIPSAGMVKRALDTVLPDGSAMVLVIWNGTAKWTGAVLRRRRGEIDLLAGPDHIARWTGPLGGDWRRDHRFITEAVDRSVAPVHLGIYGDISTFRALLRSREAGAWARAVATRDLILSPAPAYVAVAMGADAARAAAVRSAAWLGGLDYVRLLAPVASYVRGRVSEIASVNATLGFDPLKLLASMLERVDAAQEAGHVSVRKSAAPSDDDLASVEDAFDMGDAANDHDD